MLTQDEVISLLSSADLFICPSIYEPLGIVNLEAMACETAVLASNVGGVPEVVIEGETGELINYVSNDALFEGELTEKINSLMGSPDKLTSYGKAGRIRAMNNFSWDSIARDTVDLYQRVLNNL